MKFKYLKYSIAYSLPLTVAVALSCDGPLTFLPLLYVYGLIPLVELLLGSDPKNLSQAEVELRKVDPIYDYLLYLIVPIQYGFLVWFLFAMSQPELSWMTIVGRVSAMGLMCGAYGINVAHELGHRASKHEQWMSKALLLTSLYMHFFIEHNRGHHRNVATPDDPATAKRNQWLHTFLIQSVIFSYLSAWNIERKSLKRKGIHPLSLQNEMLRFLIIQVALVVGIAVFFSTAVMLYFVAAAGIGIFLLETVNYIEHYGLERRKVSSGKYERTMPHHSWNSDHILGRMLLFELSRHSDHHFIASKKYQVLEHYDEVPQMPTGYPGMVVLACVPPVWFRVMNPRVDRWNQHAATLADSE